MAAQLAALLPGQQLKALIVVVAGTTHTFQDSLLHSIPHAPPEVSRQLAEMRRQPVWDREWGSNGTTARNTYKWWADSLDAVTAISLEKVVCPILLIHGDQDPMTPPQTEAELRQRLSGKEFRYVRVTGCGHDIAANPEGQ